MLFDTTQGIQTGIIRGIGKSSYASIGSIIAFYIISLPLAYYFAFVLGVGLKGLWTGMACGESLLMFYY
jgi:MATE family multidrug resistance protein